MPSLPRSSGFPRDRPAIDRHPTTCHNKPILMIFVDEVTVDIAAGNGGRGAVAFRKEKYVPPGGPSGGDGGRGGDVILEADSNMSTLLDFQFQHKYSATHGSDGASKDMYGKDA